MEPQTQPHKKPQRILVTELSTPEIHWPVDICYLHSTPMSVDGRAETTLSKQKIPSIKALGWSKSFEVFVIESQTGTHVLPSAAVRDTKVLCR